MPGVHSARVESPFFGDETGILLKRGLPVNLDAERFLLGAVLLDGRRFPDVAATLTPDDFALEKHRRIFARMGDLHRRDEVIDRVTLANELMRWSELESVDGMSYLVSLDDGLPQIAHLDSYVRIVQQKATLRRLAIGAQHLLTRALLAEEDPADILKSGESLWAGLQAATAGSLRIEDLPAVGAQQEPRPGLSVPRSFLLEKGAYFGLFMDGPAAVNAMLSNSAWDAGSRGAVLSAADDAGDLISNDSGDSGNPSTAVGDAIVYSDGSIDPTSTMQPSDILPLCEMNEGACQNYAYPCDYACSVDDY